MKPILFSTYMVQAILDGRKTMTRRVVKPQPLWIGEPNVPFKTQDADHKGIINSPYQPRDILYVRETWHQHYDGSFAYKATDPKNTGWHPSIHMPREAARIFLEVTDVRVERLQEITEEDAIKEGVRVGIGGMPYFSCQDAFPALWDSTIKNQDLPLYGWDSNCWVWIYEFKRLEGRA